MGLRPGQAHASAAGISETTGGALIAAGLFTPLGASLLSGTMLTAIRKVHAANGVWVSKGGYEYNLVLLADVFAISDLGPGRLSLDEALGIRRAGPGWAIAQLLAGAAGSWAAVTLGERQPAPYSPEGNGARGPEQAHESQTAAA
jgi:putative oxidoreductase